MDRINAIGYSRKSRAADAETMENRQAIVRRIADNHNLNLIEIVEENESGSNRERLGLARVLAAVQTGKATHIVTPDRARISRDARHWLDIEDILTDSRAVLVTEEGIVDYRQLDRQKLPQRVVDAVHEWEREEYGRRMRRANRERIAAGIPLSGCNPYGYQRSKEKGHEPSAEYPILCEMLRRIVTESLNEIARDLNARGIPTPAAAKGQVNAGSDWLPSTVRDIVKNPFYAGYVVHRVSHYGKRVVTLPEPLLSEVEGSWQKPITLAQHQRIVAKIASYGSPGQSRKSLLGGLVACHLGRPMSYGGGGYHCKCLIYDGHQHAGYWISGNRLEPFIRQQISVVVDSLPTNLIDVVRSNGGDDLNELYKAAQQRVRQKERAAAAMMESEQEQIAAYGKDLYFQAAANVRKEYEAAREEVTRIEQLIFEPNLDTIMQLVEFLREFDPGTWGSDEFPFPIPEQSQLIRGFVQSIQTSKFGEGQIFHKEINIKWHDWCLPYTGKTTPQLPRNRR